MVCGAVYRPVALIVPKVELPPGRPSTNQFTLWLEFPVTVAVNCCVAPPNTFTLEGVTTMKIPALGPTVTAELATALLSAMLVAVMVTPAGVGITEGAV